MERVVALLMVGVFTAFWIWWLVSGKMRLDGRRGRSYLIHRATEPIRYWLSMAVFGGGVVFFAMQLRQQLDDEVAMARPQGEPSTEQVLASGPRGLRDLPPEIAAYRDSALALYNAHQYAAAIGQFDQAVAWTQDDPQLYYWRGMAQWHVGRTDLALRDVQRAATIDPTSADAKMYLEQLTRLEARKQRR